MGLDTVDLVHTPSCEHFFGHIEISFPVALAAVDSKYDVLELSLNQYILHLFRNKFSGHPYAPHPIAPVDCIGQ